MTVSVGPTDGFEHKVRNLLFAFCIWYWFDLKRTIVLCMSVHRFVNSKYRNYTFTMDT
jgi:hypothetical protein